MSFHSDLAKTDTPEARAAYERAVSACLGTEAALRFTTVDEDKNGIDFYAVYGTGHKVEKSVQAKICWGALDKPFYPYETVNGSGGPGWVFSHDPADLILWIRATTPDFEQWNARLYSMPPIIGWLKSNETYVLSKTTMNRFHRAGVYLFFNSEAERWLVGRCWTRGGR
jgi:hypothetical protein